MSRGDPEWIAQLRMYDPPDGIPEDRTWRSPLGRRTFTLPFWVRAVYGHDCAGHPIVRPRRASDRHTTSLDLDGYERRRGVQEAVARWPDGSAVLAIERDVAFRG